MSDYRYLNLNPFKKRTGDCVIRAVACAFGLEWEQASDILYETARNLGCEMSCLGCYSSLFRKAGLEEVDAEGMTVEDIVDRYSSDIVIIRISGHLTCAINGCVMDIWDCRGSQADRAWLVGE